MAFRYITDSGVNEGGFWVRNINVGSTTLPSDSLDGWQSVTQVHPVAVQGWTVQLIGIADNQVTWHHKLKLDKSFEGVLSGKQLRSALGARATTVAALVTMDDPGETLTKYGRYKLRVKAPVAFGHRSGR